MEANLGGEERRGNKQGAGNRAIRPRLTLTTKAESEQCCRVPVLGRV